MSAMSKLLFCKRFMALGATLSMGLLVAACTMPLQDQQEPAPQAAVPEECTAPAADEPVVGNWINKRQEKGVTGELRTLFTLKADGSMLFTEQLKRPRQPSQGLNETGCWYREGNELILHTYTSNGVPVDAEDPIYTNRYRILSVEQEQLDLRSAPGLELRTQRSSPGYRLPF